MKKKPLGIIIFMILIVGTVIVSALPPQAVQSSTGTLGFEIAYPKYSTTKQSTDFDLFLHVFNSSNGIPMNTGSCQIHLYDGSGEDILEKELSKTGYEYNVLIKGGNFSNLGIYSYIIYCNSSIQGGFVSGLVEVTTSGVDNSTLIDNKVVYSLFFIIIILGIIVFRISNNQESLITLFLTVLVILYVILSTIAYNVMSNAYTNGLRVVLQTNFYLSISVMVLWFIIITIKYLLKGIKAMNTADEGGISLNELKNDN